MDVSVLLCRWLFSRFCGQDLASLLWGLVKGKQTLNAAWWQHYTTALQNRLVLSRQLHDIVLDTQGFPRTLIDPHSLAIILQSMALRKDLESPIMLLEECVLYIQRFMPHFPDEVFEIKEIDEQELNCHLIDFEV